MADELLDDTEALRRLITETAALMPYAPKPVKPRKAKRAGQAGGPALDVRQAEAASRLGLTQALGGTPIMRYAPGK